MSAFLSDGIEGAGTPDAPEWLPEWGITEEKIRNLGKLRGKRTASGPDGVSARVWALKTGYFADQMQALFNPFPI